MKKSILVIFLLVYFGMVWGQQVSFLGGCFIRPKGLWNLVPFRINGFKSLTTGKIYKIKWIWNNIDFNDYIDSLKEAK